MANSDATAVLYKTASSCRANRYYADGTSFTATVPESDESTIEDSARLDLLWPTMYANSNDTKAVYAAVSLSTANQPVFRYFPGTALSSDAGSLFACEGGEGNECYDPTIRPWYEAAVSDTTGRSDTGLGDVVITDPYIGAMGAENDWLVTIARAVYSDDGLTAGQLLGVVAVDVRLEHLQQSIEDIHFLESGYSIFATAGDGIVLAAPTRVWDKTEADNSTAVCQLGNGICSGDGWTDLLLTTAEGVYAFTDDEGEESILVAAHVNATFDTDTGDGTITHYILSAVPRDEIFEPVHDMADRIRASATDIIIYTAAVAAATLVIVGVAVYVLAGNITRPIVEMTKAASSIATDGAKTNVFGGVLAVWGGGGEGGSGMNGSSAGAYSSRGTRVVDYLLCRGEDEINTLAREFSLMVTGLGKRGKAAMATGLEDSSVYPVNPFTTAFVREPPTAPSAPSAPPGL